MSTKVTHCIPLCLGKFSLLPGGSEGKGPGPAPVSPEAAEPGESREPQTVRQGRGREALGCAHFA